MAQQQESLAVTIPASIAAGFVARLICHPIDTCKARLQAVGSASIYKTTFDVIRNTLKTEGIAGLYRGLPAAVVGSAPAVCLYMGGFEASRKALLQTKLFADHPAAADFTAGMCAETLSCIIFVPVDVVKERLQVQGVGAPGKGSSAAYKGSLDALVTIMREEGLRGVYKGYGATLFSFGPFSAFYFLIYEDLKKRMNDYNIQGSGSTAARPPPLSLLQSFSCSAVAGAVAGVITNPLDMVKLRLQVQRRAGAQKVYNGIVDGLYRLVKEEGVRGMLRGAGARVAFHVPNTAITFAVYERVKAHLAGQ